MSSQYMYSLHDDYFALGMYHSRRVKEQTWLLGLGCTILLHLFSVVDCVA